MNRRLFLDLDGVLADFDAGVQSLLGMSAGDYQAAHSVRDFWLRIRRADDFYNRLPEMPDARDLFEAVSHLGPVILTGLPIGNWAAPQKQAWVARHFPGTKVITTLARDKHLHLTGRDVLVDDRDRYRSAWEDAGGHFVHHRCSRLSLVELARYFPSIAAPD